MKIKEISPIQSHKNFDAPLKVLCVSKLLNWPLSRNLALACRISQTSFCKMGHSMHMIADVWQVSALPESWQWSCIDEWRFAARWSPLIHRCYKRSNWMVTCTIHCHIRASEKLGPHEVMPNSGATSWPQARWTINRIPHTQAVTCHQAPKWWDCWSQCPRAQMRMILSRSVSVQYAECHMDSRTVNQGHISRVSCQKGPICHA